MKNKTKFKIRTPLYFLIIVAVVGMVSFTWYKNWQSKFEAPRQNIQPIQFTIGKNFTLDAVIGDLKYYDFIKNEEAFRYALTHSKDSNPGRENALKIGNNTIDREAVYTISQSMTTWQLAEVLLSQGNYQPCNHGCPESNFIPELLPGGDLDPTIKEKYSWVKTYDDCVKSIGHDGGQLSSEQNFIQTGRPRKCVSPDGREFTQGQEGWNKAVGG